MLSKNPSSSVFLGHQRLSEASRCLFCCFKPSMLLIQQKLVPNRSFCLWAQGPSLPGSGSRLTLSERFGAGCSPSTMSTSECVCVSQHICTTCTAAGTPSHILPLSSQDTREAFVTDHSSSQKLSLETVESLSQGQTGLMGQHQDPNPGLPNSRGCPQESSIHPITVWTSTQ